MVRARVYHDRFHPAGLRTLSRGRNGSTGADGAAIVARASVVSLSGGAPVSNVLGKVRRGFDCRSRASLRAWRGRGTVAGQLDRDVIRAGGVALR